MNVEAWVRGIHSVSNQEGAIVTVQNLGPNPGKLLPGRNDLHFEGVFTW